MSGKSRLSSVYFVYLEHFMTQSSRHHLMISCPILAAIPATMGNGSPSGLASEEIALWDSLVSVSTTRLST